MSVAQGAKVPRRWSPLRAAVEHILSDGAWHEAETLFYQVERYVDPRVAARSWARYYEQNRQRKLARGVVEDVEPASRWLVKHEEKALAQGKWRVYWDVVRGMRDLGHVETVVWGGRRRVRLKPG